MDKKHFDEIPTISSTLRWEEISLPEAMSEADLDQIIFSVMTSRLQKTAMVVGKADARLANQYRDPRRPHRSVGRVRSDR
jgi:hypothetical protein